MLIMWEMLTYKCNFSLSLFVICVTVNHFLTCYAVLAQYLLIHLSIRLSDCQ